MFAHMSIKCFDLYYYVSKLLSNINYNFNIKQFQHEFMKLLNFISSQETGDPYFFKINKNQAKQQYFKFLNCLIEKNTLN